MRYTGTISEEHLSIQVWINNITSHFNAFYPPLSLSLAVIILYLAHYFIAMFFIKFIIHSIQLNRYISDKMMENSAICLFIEVLAYLYHRIHIYYNLIQ